MPKPRKMIIPGGQELQVIEVQFEVVNEGWNEYKLSNGTTLRVKNVVTRIFLETDDEGNIKHDEHGEPNAVVNFNATVVPVSEED